MADTEAGTLRYVRTRGGSIIHRAECKHGNARNARPAPWDWADDKTPHEILEELDVHGLDYHWCGHCFPHASREQDFGWDIEGCPR